MLNADTFDDRPWTRQRPAELTLRQHEVVALIAQGRTNREIGERLCITQGTVANHVANILDRLGHCSRTQVAVWAARHTELPVKTPNMRSRWTGASIKRSDGELSQQGLLTALVQNLPDALLVIERGARCYSVANTAAARILGYTRAELLRLGPPELTPSSALPALLEAFVVLSREGSWRGEWSLRRKDGSTICADASVVVVRVGQLVLYQSLFRAPVKAPRLKTPFIIRPRSSQRELPTDGTRTSLAPRSIASRIRPAKAPR
jgi:PAS domain S-box-containing protein